MTKVTIDTNLLIDDENILLKLSKKYDKIVIPLTVIKELDKLKHRPDTSYSARRAIRAIRNFMSDSLENIEFYTNDTLRDDNDAKIIEAANITNSTLATKDLSMSILADAMGVPTEVYDLVLNGICKPYVYIKSTDLYEKSLCNTGDYFCYDQLYTGNQYDYFNKLIEDSGNVANTNMWYFVFINDVDKIYIYAHNPKKRLFERIDNQKEYRSIYIENSISVDAMDEYQVCAIYALKSAPHVVITGKWGTGKSLLTTAYSVSTGANKTFLTRAPVGINKKYDLGFMPGSKLEKMEDWLSGITSSLYFLYANTRMQDGGSSIKKINYDHIKDYIFRDKFEVIPINAIQGLSLLERDLLLVDEIQLLDIDTMSMILSRPGKKGKLILAGDLNQTYSTLKPSESGLLKLLRVLPHSEIAYVDLKIAYRSSILEVADKLQDRTIY